MAEELNQAEMKNLCLKEGKNLWDSKYKPKPLQSVPEYPVPKELCQILKQNLQLHPNISEKGEEWLSFLKLLPELKDIEETNYLEILERLLFLEEYYSEGSIEQSSSSKKQLIRRLSDSSDRFIIRLPELAEDSSTLKPNDIVEVQEVSYLKKYNLEVVHVTKTYITVKAESAFLNSYKADGRYFIKLICSNWPIRVCHFAISLIRNYKLTLLLHPVLKEVSNQPKKDLNWFDKNIENNPEQMQAVQRILGRTAHPAPYILFGPPGTGKTATIVEAISQLSGSHLNRILVCTPSNAAADEITKRLLCNIPEHLLYRMLSPSVDKKDVAESIHSCLHFVGGAVTFLQKELIMSKKVVITTLVTCARLVRMNWWRNHFTYIFLDEAGQATQAESLIPFGLMRDEEERAQLIMSGDPKQLGPVVMTKHGQHLLGKSMLERLMDCSEPYQKNEENKYDPNFITKLLKNYRSHEALLRIPNQLFYNNELVACGGEDIYRAENWWELPREKFPVIFHAVHGYEEKDNNSPSVCNEIEAQVVMNYVYKLLGSPLGGTQIEEKDIGILTPFRYQRSIILQALNSKGLHNISVGTVESFQGQEKDIIIVTTVRSAIFQHDGKFHVGFLSDDKRFNVTITRAKSLLILVGNPKVLQIDDCWRKLIEYCLENKACVGDKFTLSDLTDVEMRNLISNRSHSSDQGTNSPKIKTENIVSEAKGISPSFVNGSLDEDFGTCNSYNNGALEDFPKHLRFPSSFNECTNEGSLGNEIGNKYLNLKNIDIIDIPKSEYEVSERILGKGAQGIVRLGKHCGTKVAVKSMLTGTTDLAYLREILTLNKVRHCNIIAIRAISTFGGQNDIIMEYFESRSLSDEIFDKSNRKILLSLKNKNRIAYQICCALSYLHSLKIVHRDVKLSNILISVHGLVKLCDFGLAIIDVSSFDVETTHAITAKGTYLYMPPEIFFEKKKATCSSDIWSLGASFVELYSEKRVWDVHGYRQVFHCVEDKYLKQNIPNLEDIPLKLLTVMQQTFEYNDEKRPTAAQLLKILGELPDCYRLSRTN